MSLAAAVSTTARAAQRQLLLTGAARAAFSSSSTSFGAAAATDDLKKTHLHAFHVAQGGKMVPYAGYEMPVQYADGIRDSHLFVRSDAGVFDVSHMGQVRIRGRDRTAFLEQLVVADVQGLAPGAMTLSVFTNDKGGIIDDTIITQFGEELGLVVNAGCKDKDLAHLAARADAFRASGKDVSIVELEDRSLLALQGPRAAAMLTAAFPKAAPAETLAKLGFMRAVTLDLFGRGSSDAACLVSRCGYTGEDGFEISVPHEQAAELAEAFMAQGARLAGLGARDTLRLEAGLCLYGNDIDETTTPVAAGLTWTIGKRRRAEGGFLGADTILAQVRDGVSRRRAGFVIKSGPPARGHEKIFTPNGQEVGVVTSGGFGSSVGGGIGMGYLDKPYNKIGTDLLVEIRKKRHPITVAKMPFVPSNYYTPPK